MVGVLQRSVVQQVVTFRFREEVSGPAQRAEYTRIEKYFDTMRGFRHQMRHMCHDGTFAIAAYLLPVDSVIEYLYTVASVDSATVSVRPP